MQDSHPVCYASRKFIPAELNYSVTDQEALASIHAIQIWRCYLEGTTFKLVTDHCPLTYLKSQPQLSRRQARWSEILQQFDFEWEYRPGRANVADPLSRIPEAPDLYKAKARGQVAVLWNYGDTEFSSPTPRKPVKEAESLAKRIQQAYHGEPQFAKLKRATGICDGKKGSGCERHKCSCQPACAWKYASWHMTTQLQVILGRQRPLT